MTGKSFLLVLFLIISIDGISCSCGEWGGDFFDVATNAQLVVYATVNKHGFSGGSMKITIHETYSGKKIGSMTVWGDNGMQCRPYVNLFSDKSAYYLAIHKTGRTEYSLSSCGEYFVKVDGDMVKSFSHYSLNKKRIGEMSKAEFELRLKEVLR